MDSRKHTALLLTWLIGIMLTVPANRALSQSAPQRRIVAEPAITQGDTNRIFVDVEAPVIKRFEVTFDFSQWDTSARVGKENFWTFTRWNGHTRLRHGNKYWYRVFFFDNGTYSDTVWSIQDAKAPEVAIGGMPESTNAPTIRVPFEAADLISSAVDSAILWYRRDGAGPVWRRSETIDLPDVSPVDSAFVFRFAQEDGYYDFFVEAVDTAWAANNTGRRGNRNGPRVSMRRILFDDTPPTPVDVMCEQIKNSIQLEWNASHDPNPGVGLMAYEVFRDDTPLATVFPSQTSYRDSLFDRKRSVEFHYQVKPVDSLGNIQEEGGELRCRYVGEPSITMRKEPPFTAGRANEVCWKTETERPLARVEVFLDANCNTSSNTSIIASSGAFCVTFGDLIDGQLYCYWVEGLDAEERLSRSDTVHSIQDASPPSLDTLIVVDGKLNQGVIWVFSNEIRLILRGRDASPGEIWSYAINENGLAGGDQGLRDSSNVLNEEISYTLKSGPKELVNLSARILDGAGNESVFALPFQLAWEDTAAQPELYAFPNPFNPMERKMTIRFSGSNETEVRIYDFFGNLVRVLDNKIGNGDFLWDGQNGAGEMVANGVYICVGQKTRARFKIGVKKIRF